MLFLADSEEDSGCREVALVILVTCPSVLEQDAETQNAACDWLRRLRTEMSSPDAVNAHGRQIETGKKLTAHSRNVPPPSITQWSQVDVGLISAGERQKCSLDRSLSHLEHFRL